MGGSRRFSVAMRPLWTQWHGIPHFVLDGHTDEVRGVACAIVDRTPVAVTTSDDRTVRVWDLSTPTPLGRR